MLSKILVKRIRVNQGLGLRHCNSQLSYPDSTMKSRRRRRRRSRLLQRRRRRRYLRPKLRSFALLPFLSSLVVFSFIYRI